MSRLSRALGIALLTAAPALSMEVALGAMSLEELMDVDVSLVSRRSEPASRAPAAVAVLRSEELRRSGVTTLAEALRLVPGMQVARIDANKWAIGARGFNSRFSNKLLVQIDGRSIYSPFFSGVFWEDHDIPLEDVERIEVIRGPGATLWGANAVDGIVNVVTRHAADSEGTFLQVGGGKEERALLSARHGGRWRDIPFRVSGTASLRDRSSYTNGDPAHDGWQQGRVGFRADWDRNGDALSLQGGVSAGRMAQCRELIFFDAPFVTVRTDSIEAQGAFVLGRWRRELSADSETVLQAFVDYHKRHEVLDIRSTTMDVDFHHRLRLSPRADVVWGLSSRTHSDRTGDETPAFRLSPASRRGNRFGTFLQGSLDLLPERLRLTAGSKVEHNSTTGLEWQPGARLAWTPTPNQTLWTSVARAVRTPSRVDRDAFLTVSFVQPGESSPGVPMLPAGTPPAIVTLSGNPDFDSESVVALEAGYRMHIDRRWRVDVALFHNEYENLADAELASITPHDEPTPHLVIDLLTTNGLSGQTRGLEIAVDGQLTDRWRVGATYTALDVDAGNAGGVYVDQLRLDATTPSHQAGLHSSLDWGAWQVDGRLRYVDELSGLGVDGYVDASLRVARPVARGMELAVVGRNLLQAGHVEFVPRFFPAETTETERTLFVTLTLRR
jgi:iron complex outermembrane receptor protein